MAGGRAAEGKIASKGGGGAFRRGALAVLFGQGIRGQDAVSFSRSLLLQFGGLRGILTQQATAFEKVKGLGLAKTAMLFAVREIGLRQLREKMIGQNFVRSPQAVTDYLTAALRDRNARSSRFFFWIRRFALSGNAIFFTGRLMKRRSIPARSSRPRWNSTPQAGARAQSSFRQGRAESRGL